MPEKLILRDWNRIRAWLEPRLPEMKLISLDIFDTLLSRCVGDPAEVQQAVCRVVSERTGIDVETVLEARRRAEQELRVVAVVEGFDHECRYSDLLPRWVSLLPSSAVGDNTADLIAFIRETELDLETAALHVKPEAQVFLDWLTQQGVEVAAISDMYLDGKLLCELLRRKRVVDYFTFVYASSDFRLGKHSGRLFQKMLQVEGLEPSQVVHIGDNPVSDRRMACREGIQGIWLYEKADLRRRERQVLSASMAQRGGIWQGRHFFEAVQTRSQQHGSLEPRDFFFRYGRDVLGPAFSVFMQGLQERVRRQAEQGQPLEKLLFVARDGFLFHRMYSAAGGEVPAEYVYLSRKVITAASVAEGLTPEQAQVAFYNPKQCGLESVCKVYGLPAEELKPIAVLHGFEDFAEPIHDWGDARLHSFLEDGQVQALISKAGRRHRDLLQAYLQQVGFFSCRRLGLVDIGWNGTVQKFLKQAFGGRADFPALHGYYFAFVPKMYADFGKDNFCEGIVLDSRRGNACERMPAEFEEVFEQGARAQEATTVGYEEAEGVIRPVLKAAEAPDRQAELRCNPSVARMQEGILHHWEHFRAVQGLAGYSSQQLLPYVYGLLERAVVYPTREEARELTRLAHTEDFGHDHVLELGNRPLGFGDLLRPHRLLHRLEFSAWRYALFDRIPGGVANFAFRMAYLHTVKK